MLSVAYEEHPWVDSFPAHGVVIDELTLAMRECPAQEGVLFSLSCKETPCAIWLPVPLWQQWCEVVIGTSDISAIDPLLLHGIAEWALSPLLRAGDATLRQDEHPLRCSNAPQHIALNASWRVDQHDFHALLFGWPPSFFATLAEKVQLAARQTHPCLPVIFPLYIGWTQLTLAEIAAMNTDMGVRMRCFGNARAGIFAMGLPGGFNARVWLTAEKTMKFDELVDDIETLLATEAGIAKEEAAQPVELDRIPQKVVFEVGQASVELGRLRQLQTGDILPASGHFTPEVTLRLIDGRAIGRGELVACGSEFLVRITRWYLTQDTVNT
ncbi:YscQ/HrcQ family type III secretion apparatus protein [Kosakonia sp. BYX6]|uniref:YscQ/HrcQ family type III secretion apparatus protein n=1 Tax=Kosakonia calanthes TaxID=3139408 RepID=A0ABZ3B787_9ENTR